MSDKHGEASTVRETRAVRFYLDGQLHRVVNPQPTTTVLNYLRETLGRTGTKEGCAEGDCGACTVVVADLDGDGYRLRAINSCIQFLPTLDGKELITVESLRQSDRQLHPVQRALVDCHGSQCGFCTPGFVMSLFTLYKAQAAPTRGQIDDVLSGNLCRCTGYRPIVAAAAKMYDYAQGADQADWKTVPASDRAPRRPLAGEQALVSRLRAIQRRRRLHLNGAPRYFAPVCADDLAHLLSEHPDATLLAGGTDVGLWVTKQFRPLRTIIYIGDVKELNVIDKQARGMTIGACVSLQTAFEHIIERYPDLREMFRRFASPPIRNAGTLVGNIANGSPIGDSMPALITLGAEVLMRKGADSRSIPLDQFYLGYQKTAREPGEFVQAVRLPMHRTQQRLRCYKIAKRYDQDISAVCGAYSVHLEHEQVVDIRICYGGMAEIPKRARGCERALIGKPWTEHSIEASLASLKQDYSPLSDMRASAQYRELVAANLLKRFYYETAGAGVEPRVFDYTGAA